VLQSDRFCELYPANILFQVCWDVIKKETNASRTVMPKAYRIP